MEAWHVARTMRVLELLAYTPLSAPRIAEALGAHPRTARRVLSQLVEEEYLVCGDDHRRLYQPTMRMVALAGQVLHTSTLVARARPYVSLAHERTGGVARLMMPSYQAVLCVLRCEDGEIAGPHVLEAVPAHCSAGGKVLLAWRERWRDSVLATPLQRLTDRTVTDALSLRRELDEVRREGYATEDGEAGLGAPRAVAAPIFDAGQAVAALQVSGAAAAGDIVTTSARELSDSLKADRP